MKTITQYKEDIKHLMAKVAEFDATAINENRDLTDSEILLKNEMLDTVEELNKMVATLERQERVQTYLETPEKPKTVENGKKTRIEDGEDRRSKDRFHSFGEQMAAIMRAGLPGGNVDPRLFNAASGASETVPSDGGLRAYA